MLELLDKYVEFLHKEITEGVRDEDAMHVLVDQCYIRVLKDELKLAKSGVDDACPRCGRTGCRTIHYKIGGTE